MRYALKNCLYLTRKPIWWIGVAISFSSMLIGILPEKTDDQTNLIYHLFLAMDAGVFLPLAPLSAIIPAAFVFENAFKKSWRNLNLIRCNKVRYIVNTAVGSALAGGAALSLGWLLALVVSAVMWRLPLTGSNMLGVENTDLGALLLSNRTTLLYYMFRFFLVFSYGFFCVMLSLPTSVMIPDAATICLVPFVLLRIMQYFFVDRILPILSPTRVLLGKNMGFSSPQVTFAAGLLGLMCWALFLVVLSIICFQERCSFE